MTAKLAGDAFTGNPPGEASPRPVPSSPLPPPHPAPAPITDEAGRPRITGGLLRKVAHDVVGPVGVASGALKELQNALGSDGARHASMLSLAFRSLLRLERLAKRLRLTALVRDGGLELEPEALPLAEVVATAFASASNLDGRKNIVVEAPIVPDGLRVKADKEHLGVIVGELVSNALRFARKAVKVGVGREGDLVVLSFEDDGPGFPPELTSAGVSSLAPEAGLALPIVAAVATRFGGRLVLGRSSLTSKDGKPGAMARLELPVAS
jgi:signal transduction histidine kinase